MGNCGSFPRGSQLQQSRATQPTMHAGCFVCLHIPPNFDMDHRIFNVRTYVNACGCTRRCTDTVRESAQKVDWESKSLAAPGNGICLSGVPVRHSINRATSPTEGTLISAFAACRFDTLSTELHPQQRGL